MEGGAAVNTAETIQLVLQENSVEDNEEPNAEVGEVGATLDSTCHSIQEGMDDYSGSGSGAGAIAGSREDMKFVANNSFSELVWSPLTGLRVKCTDCSIDEKKRPSSLLGTTKSSNVMLPPSQTFLTLQETNNKDKFVDRETPSSSPQSAVHFNCQVSDPVNLIRSSSINPIGIIPTCKTISLEQIPGLSRDMEESTIKIQHSIENNIIEDDHLVRKEKKICNPTETGTTNGSLSANLISNVHEKAPTPDDVKLGLENADPEYKKETISNQFSKNQEAAGGNGLTADKASSGGEDFKALVIEDQKDKNEKIVNGSGQLLLKRQESAAEDDLQSPKGDNKCIPEHKVTEPESAKNVDSSAEASLNNNDISLCQAKGKEKVTSNTELTGRTSEEDESHESVESCSSTGLILARKRPSSYEQKLVCGDKKLKEKSHENPDSSFTYLRNSSFVNWISNVMKGVCKSGPDERRPLALTMKPHQDSNSDQHSDLNGENYQSGAIAGFESIFTAMYCPGTAKKETTIPTRTHRLGEASKEVEQTNKTYFNNSIPIAFGEDNDKLCNKIIISADDKSNQENNESGDNPSSDLPNIPSKSVNVYHQNNLSDADINNSSDKTCGLQTNGLKSSNSSIPNELDSASQGKEAKNLCLIHPNKSLNNIPSLSDSPSSLWITRFLPKASDHIINPVPCNHSSTAVFEDSRGPSSDEQVDFEGRKKQNYAVNGIGFFGSLRTTEHSDQKCQSKLNLIQPSQRFKGSEAMASVFARRLDALKNIKPSDIKGDASRATTACLFCGAKGHGLKNCPEIMEKELDNLLKKVNSLDGVEVSSCFCIYCFQLNHWANACPKKLPRKRSHSSGSYLPDLNISSKTLLIPRNTDLADNYEKNPSDIKNDEFSVVGMGCGGKKLRLSEGIVDETDYKKGESDMKIPYGKVADLKPTINDISGNVCEKYSLKNTSKEFKLVSKQKITMPSSFDNNLRGEQVFALCNIVNRQIPAVPRETFEVIKKLRLSRTDILKWMRSPVLVFCLEGFFLRLRLRKLEGMEGTGYYVACINGAFKERSEGTEIPLSVCIGGLKFSVESRFVSNHEFIEDELMAWWCATLKSGSELPSQEDLRKKLEVRKSYGL